MKRILAIVFLVIVLLGIWWLFFKTDKPETVYESESTQIHVSKHSEEFNSSISNTLNAYFDMQLAFVEADTTLAKEHTQKFIAAVDNISTDELEKDAPQIIATVKQQLSDIKANAEPILKEKDITEMRQDFRMISENLYPFLRIVEYEGDKVYWQSCPMAFGDNEASWLSATRQIANPYLGKNHPEYKSTMLRCGEVKDSIYAK
ncbi:MAG: DUF3347 domain-containing protein [Ginsengibacter sp.]